jgi:hypothetical protein
MKTVYVHNVANLLRRIRLKQNMVIINFAPTRVDSHIIGAKTPLRIRAVGFGPMDTDKLATMVGPN